MTPATQKLHDFAQSLPPKQGIELMTILTELTQEQIDAVLTHRTPNQILNNPLHDVHVMD